MQKMSEKEAIEVLSYTPLMRYERIYEKNLGHTSQVGTALKMAIQPLEKQSMVNELLNEYRELEKELDAYKAIRTLEECREAVEKMKPKRVLIKPWSAARCPTCGKILSTNDGDGYYTHWTHIERCPNVDCSQRLLWEE